MKMYVGGEWVSRTKAVEVLNPFDGSVIDTVPHANLEDVALSIASAVRGAAARYEA